MNSSTSRHSFLLIGSLMLFIIFNNTLLRNLKDSLLVMSNGALSIAFVKMWGVLPITFLVLIIYTKLSNLFKQATIFYSFIFFFVSFFSLFSFFVIPLQDNVEPVQFCDWLTTNLPKGFEQPIGIIRHWPSSLFYVGAELWSSVIVSLLFWQFVNSVTAEDQAKKYYPLLGQIADIGMILGGIVLTTSVGSGNWSQDLTHLTLWFLCAAAVIVVLYAYLNRRMDKNGMKKAQQKTGLSLKESFLHLQKSPEIRSLAGMVMGYAVVSNLVDVIWKNELQLLSKNESEFTSALGYISILTGFCTISSGFLGSFLLRRYGWFLGALIPPYFLLVTGLGFFMTILASISGFEISSWWILGCGLLQIISGKALKFSFFDATKEMAFISLDVESRIKGKAAIDLVAVRLGKSGSSCFHQFIALIFGSIHTVIGLYLSVFLVVIYAWINSVKSLYEKSFKKTTV